MPCPLISRPDPGSFQNGLRCLRQRFRIYATTSPEPLPAPGLLVTPEIRRQSELYLPIAGIRPLFYRLYCQSLAYAPLFCSSPFHATLSWADCFAALPCWLQFSPDPARLLKRLLDDPQLLARFIFSSFLPARFNGAGFGRYPAQMDWLRQHLPDVRTGFLQVLDAACGSGEGTWELTELLAKTGRHPDQAQLEGWTLEPLEVWAAAQQRLPHAPEREKNYQQRVQPLFEQGWRERVSFRVVDLLSEAASSQRFDLIICNGLLGGPIIHQPGPLQQVVAQITGLLSPGGVLLVANRFHEGWKKQVSQDLIVRLLRAQGLEIRQAGEGLAGCKP